MRTQNPSRQPSCCLDRSQDLSRICNRLFPPSLPYCHLTWKQSRRSLSPKLSAWHLSKIFHGGCQYSNTTWSFHQTTPVPVRILNKPCLWVAARLKKCQFLLRITWNFVISGLYWAAFIRKWSLHLNENLLLLLVPSEPSQVNII